jgi:very-short-patch-repair endonuclease
MCNQNISKEKPCLYCKKLFTFKKKSADFYHKPSKSIIEFDGDYWHGEKRGNKKRDADRDAILIKEGFRILHIRERDYKADPIKIVKDCVEFLNG